PSPPAGRVAPRPLPGLDVLRGGAHRRHRAGELGTGARRRRDGRRVRAMALEDELVNRVTWKIPNALALVGSRAGEERNGMTTSWITQLSMEPILIGVSVDNNAVTHRLITEGGSFTVNLWDSEDTRVFVKFSKPAANEPGTLNGRPIRDGITGAPIFEEAIAWMECEVRHAH